MVTYVQFVIRFPHADIARRVISMCSLSLSLYSILMLCPTEFLRTFLCFASSPCLLVCFNVNTGATILELQPFSRRHYVSFLSSKVISSIKNLNILDVPFSQKMHPAGILVSCCSPDMVAEE